MRARVLRATGILPLLATFLAMGLPACGIDAQGLLAVDRDASSASDPGEDAASSSRADDATTGALDAGVPVTSDDGSIVAPPPDATAPHGPDGGAIADAGVDAPTSVCAACTAQMCPTQLAACGKGSACAAYHDCTVACGFSGVSACSSACGTKLAAGKSAFDALTLCDIGCGGSCVAQLAVTGP
jgi:hypothetical protein